MYVNNKFVKNKEKKLHPPDLNIVTEVAGLFKEGMVMITSLTNYQLHRIVDLDWRVKFKINSGSFSWESLN